MSAPGEANHATYDVAAPKAAGPYVFASPHSGTVYPADMAPDPTLGEASLRSAEDALVDRLIAPGVQHGAVVVTSRIARAYVDLNRDAADLDPLLIDGVPKDGGSARSSAGYGVIPRLTGDGQPIYARKLSLEEAQDRIDRVHAPWHAELERRMRTALAAHGGAILIDWHSMPAPTGGVRGPDIVLGNRHGAACSGAVTRRVQALFEREGFRVALNQPYAGGWTTERWGRPSDRFEALQIEISRALYFDAAEHAPSPGWDRTATRIGRVVAGLLGA